MKHRALPPVPSTLKRAGEDFGEKRWRQARAGFALVLKSAPRHPEARFGYAAACVMDRAPTDAIPVLEELLDEFPGKATIWEHLGIGLMQLMEYEEAARAYRRAWALWPERLSPLVHLAGCQCALGHVGEARSLFAQAVAMPHRGDWIERFNRSFAGLMLGAWEVGFQDFEAREPSKAVAFTAPLERDPRWNGKATRKPVVIHAEQGIGDTILMLRFLPEVLRRLHPRRPILAFPSLLHGLIAKQWPDLECRDNDAPELEAERIACMSLPAALGATTVDCEAYLTAPARRFLEDGRLRVGLVWRGNPAQVNDATRSIDLSRLIRGVVRDTTRVRWLALQHQPTDTERTQLAEAGIEDLSGEIAGDWCTLASVLAGVDALLSVDTGPAHLAGALGRPVLVLKSAIPDWRYGLVGERSPWYPSVLLLRQTRVHDWGNPLTAAAQALTMAAQQRAA